MAQFEMKLYACYETSLVPYEGYDTLIAIFDTDKAAKEYVTMLDKAYGSEYICYTYEIFELNKPTVE